MRRQTTTTRYESTRIYKADFASAERLMVEDRVPSLVEAVGCALEGWFRLPVPVRDQIIRERHHRRNQRQTVSASPQ